MQPIVKTKKYVFYVETDDILQLTQLCEKNLLWDTPVLKKSVVILWVQTFIQEKPGNFISTE